MPRKQSSLPPLSQQQRQVCEKVAAMQIALVSQRALALLLMDGGETLAETVRKTGLTIGQVRYAITRFKKIALNMFPPVSLEKTEAKAPAAKGPKADKKDKKKKDLKKKKTKNKKEKKKTKDSKTAKKKKKKSGKGKKKK